MSISLSRGRVAWLALASLCAARAPALADEIIVPTDHPLGVALAVARDGDTITILPGVYQQVPGFSFTNKRLIVRGATGNFTDVILDGAGLTTVLTISQPGAGGSIIQDLTIANGRVASDEVEAGGAGVHLSAAANVTFRNCHFYANNIVAALGNGAGIYATGCSLRIENCIFVSNTISSSGGDGGGVYLNGGAHFILDTTFISNGIHLGPSSGSGRGGGLYADNGTVQITRCDFRRNRSSRGGGVFFQGNARVAVDESIFSDNNAIHDGGGFYIDDAAGPAPPAIRNSLFVGNSAANAAAIYTDKGGSLLNLTIVANTSSRGIIGGDSPTGALAVDNSIIWGNTYDEVSGLFPEETPDLVRRCILQQAYAGAPGSGYNRTVDPRFMNPNVRNFRLSSQSPAIDAGDSSLYFGPLVDLAHKYRGVDVPEVADTGYSIVGPVIDIGAYEFQVEPPPACPPDYDRDGTVDSQDLFDFLTGFFTGC